MTTTIPRSTQPALHLCFILLTVAFFSASSISHAAITQTLGSGSAVTTTSATANFENNAALTKPYTENGLTFSLAVSPNNNVCGYAGCAGHTGFAGFSGNYIYYANTSEYISISSGASIMYGLEFIAGTGYTAPPVYIAWQAYLNGTPVGDGVATLSSVQVIGFRSDTGFNELRYTTSSSAFASYSASTSTYNAPGLDTVRAQFGAPVVTPIDSSTVLTFDDIPGGSVQNTYGDVGTYKGYVFSTNLDWIDTVGSSWPYDAVSGDFTVLNNNSGVGIVTKADGGDFVFGGMSAKGWGNATVSGNVQGYNNGALVWTINTTLGATFQTIAGQSQTIDELRLGMGNYFLIDNLTFNPTTLLGEYRMDEATWTTTAGDVKDTGGNNRHGTASGTPLPTATPTTASAARTGTTGTCGYGTIATGSGRVTLSNLPVSTTSGAQTSVSFWMYWDGTTNSMPIGWHNMDLWFSGGFFGFNTGNSDIFGINSTGLANGWHHVVAIFVNNSVPNNQLYIDGVKQTLSQKLNTPLSTAASVVQSTLYISGRGVDTNNRFSGRIDEVKVYNGALSQTDVTTLYNETHTCPVYTPPTPIADYRMDESIWGGTAGEITDSSGNNLNGQAVNSLKTTNSGKLCSAGNFNGTSNYASIPDAAALRLMNNYTIAAWVKTSSSSTNTIISKNSTNSPWPGYEFALGGGGAPGRPSAWTGNGSWYASSSSTRYDDGVWHHMAMQVNSGSLQFFVDGVAQGNAISVSANTSNTGNLFIGLNTDTGCCGYRYFNGQMDEVKLWNSALSAGQIALVYSNESAGKNYDGSARSCPTLLGQYRLEEASWNGTSGEVLDSSGFARHGTAVGASGLPSTKSASPARASVSGTCGYGSFSGGTTQQGVTIGPIDYGIGGSNAFSVSAWVKTGSSTLNTIADIVSNNSAASTDTGQFWLELSSSVFYFSITTATTGRTWLASTIAPTPNTWYHLIGVYNGSTMNLYINGTLNASAAKTGAIVNYSSAFVTQMGRWTHSQFNYRAFQGDIDEVKLFNYALSSAEVTNLYNETHACPSNFGAVAATFNCVESGAAAGTGRMYTKLSSSPLAFDLVALKADGSTVETDFATSYGQSMNKSVTLELVDGSGATACASRTALSPAVSQTVTFTQTDAGRKTVNLSALGRALADVRCRVTDTSQTPTKVGCSADDFAVRPSAFTVSGSASADGTGTSASASPVLKTGASFTLSAASGVAGYNGTPKLDSTLLQAHSGAAQAGTLSGSFAAANGTTGTASASSFSYSEVGYFRLGAYGVYDDNFAAVDSGGGDCTNDFSNTAVGGKVGCKFGNTSNSSYFGRFIPNHLTASLGSHGSFAHSCPDLSTGTGFSYNGQPISYAGGARPSLSVTAYNNANVITRNYTGNFARLSTGGFSLTTPTTDALQKGKDNLTLLQLSRTAGSPSLVDNTGGNLSYLLGADTYTYQREANALINKFNNQVNLTFTAITDSDGVTTSNLPFTLSPSGAEIRYGRIALDNALGSELEDLPIPMTAEYYDGTNFVVNAADKCSVASLSITDPDTTDAIAASNSCVWDDSASSGSFKCATTAPSGQSYQEGTSLSNGNFNVYLKAPNLIGPLSVTATVDNWMKFNWAGTGNTDPTAQANFGVYRSNSRIIYFQEVY